MKTDIRQNSYISVLGLENFLGIFSRYVNSQIAAIRDVYKKITTDLSKKATVRISQLLAFSVYIHIARGLVEILSNRTIRCYLPYTKILSIFPRSPIGMVS